MFSEVAARLPNQRLLLLWRMPFLRIWRRVQRGQLPVSLEGMRAVNAFLYSETFLGNLTSDVEVSRHPIRSWVESLARRGRPAER